MSFNIQQVNGLARQYISDIIKTTQYVSIKLCDIATIRVGTTNKEQLNTVSYYDGTNIVNCIACNKEEIIYDKSILITQNGQHTGNVVIPNNPVIVNNNVIVVIPHEKINYNYVSNYLKFFGIYCVKNITKTNIENIPVLLPSDEKQNQIIEFCNTVQNVLSFYTKHKNCKYFGQYKTDQRIVDYMIDLVNPLIIDKKPESFADIAMGRGTIIRRYIEHINSKEQNNIDWKKQDILGCDINKNIRDMAVLECLFYTGQYLDEQFISCDSLKMRTNKKYMNIVSDMTCTSSYNNIRFVEQCTNMLDDNGKCAIIVPNSFLFCDKYAKTRKYLITSFNIKKIINIDSQFGVSYGQSIIFFTNTGMTKEIIFCEFRINEENNAYEQYMFSADFDDIVFNNYILYPNNYGLYFAKKETEKRQRTNSMCDISNTVKRTKNNN